MSVSKGKILLMDDEPLIQKVTGQMLKSLGYEALITAKGEEAIELYQQHMDQGTPIDALIMDLSIVGGKGAEDTIVELKKIDSKVKAILSTGFAHDRQVIEHKKYGFAAVLVKPYKLTELKETLKKVLSED